MSDLRERVAALVLETMRDTLDAYGVSSKGDPEASEAAGVTAGAILALPEIAAALAGRDAVLESAEDAVGACFDAAGERPSFPEIAAALRALKTGASDD